MKRKYEISQDNRTGLYYAHKAGYPSIPLYGSYRSTYKGVEKCLSQVKRDTYTALLLKECIL